MTRLPIGEDYPVKLYNAIGDNFEGSELVVGAAYHDYGGNNSELTDIHNQRRQGTDILGNQYRNLE